MFLCKVQLVISLPAWRRLKSSFSNMTRTNNVGLKSAACRAETVAEAMQWDGNLSVYSLSLKSICSPVVAAAALEISVFSWFITAFSFNGRTNIKNRRGQQTSVICWKVLLFKVCVYTADCVIGYSDIKLTEMTEALRRKQRTHNTRSWLTHQTQLVVFAVCT